MGIKMPGGRKLEKVESHSISNAVGAARVNAPTRGSNQVNSKDSMPSLTKGLIQTKKMASRIKVSGGP